MKRVNVKVEMNRQDKSEFINLCGNIGAEDLKLGEQSPVKDLTDMNLFRKNQVTAHNLLAQVSELHFEGEKYTEKAYLLIGIYKGQDSHTPNTIYSNMNRMKPILINAYFENREELQKFGFRVVQGKTGYRVSLPNRSPYDILDAAKKCVARHKELSKDSPLNSFDMKTFETYGKEADGYITYSNKYHDDAESVSERLNDLLGFAKDQNIRTKGTMYYNVARIRDLLLALYYGHEKQIEDWGFKIIISTTKKTKEEEENS